MISIMQRLRYGAAAAWQDQKSVKNRNVYDRISNGPRRRG